MSDVGVNSGIAWSRAAVAERRQSDQRPTTVNDVRQRTAAVALNNIRTTHATNMQSIDSHEHRDGGGGMGQHAPLIASAGQLPTHGALHHQH